MSGLGPYVRALTLFVAGVVVGTAMMSPSAAQEKRNAGLRLNHVGISVKNYEESLNFYTKTMGFREAFALQGPDGKPTLTSLEINPDTFLEVTTATADRPSGITHIGLGTDDVKAAVARLRQAGVNISDPRVGSTRAVITSFSDPNGIRLELNELGPDALQRKAVESFK